jgi:hypothetical protein
VVEHITKDPMTEGSNPADTDQHSPLKKTVISIIKYQIISLRISNVIPNMILLKDIVSLVI